MRSKVGRTLALALLLGGVGLVMGQTPQQPQGVEVVGPKQLPKQKAPPKKSNLEEMLAEALKNNPDIRVAAAKLAEADAELNRTRLQVTQKVASLHHAILSQKATVEAAQKKYDRLTALFKDRAINDNLVDEALTNLTAAKAKLAELEAQLPALLGKRQSLTAEALRSLASKTVQPRVRWRSALNDIVDYDIELAVPEGMLEGKLATVRLKVNLPQAEKLRKALQTPVKVDYKDMSFDAILKDLAKKVEGLSFRNLFRRHTTPYANVLDQGNNFEKMNLHFEEALPVSAILQALEDETGCCFYIREYGILAIQRGSAPPGAMTVEEFLRQKPAKQADNQPAGAKNPPAKSMEGVVKSVDAKGLFTITIGSDAGLAKGQTLELYWMPHQPPINDAHPFGKVRIVEVEANQAVVQPVDRLSHQPQSGDRIIGQILNK